MAAYAEGLNILRGASVGKREHALDAETTPLRDPEHYQYEFDLADAELWRRGSVVASWLLDLTASATLQDPKLERFAGGVSDSGEGRWTVKASIDEGVPSPFLPPRSTSASHRAARATSPTRCSPRCATLGRARGEDLVSAGRTDAFVFYGATGDLA